MSSPNMTEAAARRVVPGAALFSCEHFTDNSPMPPFGRFAGRPLRNVPIKYLRSIKDYWIVREEYPGLLKYLAGRERRGPLKYCKR